MARNPATIPTKTNAPAVSAPAAEWIHVAELRPWGRNPKPHKDPAAVAALAAEIKATAFGAPLVVQASSRRLIAGHKRRLAVLHLLKTDPTRCPDGAPGPGFVPVRTLDVDDATADRMAVADNAPGLTDPLDMDALAPLLDGLDDATREILGFGDAEDGGAPLEVEEIATSTLEDERFWLSVSGPLPSQPDALEALRLALESLPGVEVQFGKG